MEPIRRSHHHITHRAGSDFPFFFQKQGRENIHTQSLSSPWPAHPGTSFSRGEGSDPAHSSPGGAAEPDGETPVQVLSNHIWGWMKGWFCFLIKSSKLGSSSFVPQQLPSDEGWPLSWLCLCAHAPGSCSAAWFVGKRLGKCQQNRPQRHSLDRQTGPRPS